MPWFVVDDSAHTHPKIIKAGNAAVGLWMRCGSYAAQHLTDGIVPGDIARMYGTPPQINKLIKLGLWHPAGHTCPNPKCAQPDDGDYAMHDYLTYNPTRKTVIARREKAAERQRRHRGQMEPEPPNPPTNRELFDDESAANRRRIEDESSPIRRSLSDEYAGHSNGSRRDSHVTRARTFPSPPLPSTTDTADLGGEGAVSEARATEPDGPSPIDIDGFELTDAMRAWSLRTFGPGLDLDYETAQFLDHFRAQNVRRPNWPAEWQKWIRRSAKYASERATRPPLRAVSGGHTPFQPPTDHSVYQNGF
jgi:hypothetical protein